MIMRPPSRYEPAKKMRVKSRKRAVTVEALHRLLQTHLPGDDEFDSDDDEGEDDGKHVQEVEDDGEHVREVEDDADAGDRDLEAPIVATDDGPTTPALMPLLVAVSATVNSPLRHMLKVNDFVGHVHTVSTEPSGSGLASPYAIPPQLVHKYIDLTDVYVKGVDKVDMLAYAIQTAFTSLHDRELTLAVAPPETSVTMVAESLQRFGLRVSVVDRVNDDEFGKFRARAHTDFDVVVGSESAVRGLDLPAVRQVVLLDLPSQPSDYVHLAGRTARQGRPGTVTTLIHGRLRRESMQRLAEQLQIAVDETVLNFDAV